MLPGVIWVQAHLHLTLFRPFLELDIELIESLDGSLETIDSDSDMTEALSGLVIA